MQFLGIVAADDHGESVFEAERFGDFEVETISVELLDTAVDSVRITLRRFVENGGEGGAGVFDVEIEFAGDKGFVDEEGAAKIGFANDGNAGARFDVLGEEFRKDNLLGEKLGADGDLGLSRFVTGRKEVKDVKEVQEVKDVKPGARHDSENLSR